MWRRSEMVAGRVPKPHPKPPWERLDEVGERRELGRVRLEHLVEVTEPLVIISQIQRSGGTLLSQLFDGHPDCHAHPWELEIGYPHSRRWLPIELGSPERWFDYGILPERTSAYRDVLDAETIERIEEGARDLYERARALSA